MLDPAAISRVADSSKADRVVWGQYVKLGDQIRIDATLQDIKNNRTVPLKIEVPSEKEIPGAIDRLADSIRQKLALPDDVVKALKASSFQPTSQSVDCLARLQPGRRVSAGRQESSGASRNSKPRPRKTPPSRWLFPGWRRPTAVWAATVKLSRRPAKLWI